MDWETYYDRFFEWSTSTQVSRISSLTSFGPTDQIIEVAEALPDDKAVARLLRKTVEGGVSFTSEEICDLADCCAAETIGFLLETSRCSFSKRQLEDMWGIADEKDLERAAARNHIELFGDESDEDEEDEEDDEFDDITLPHMPKLGFFTRLFAAITIIDLYNKYKKPHDGR